MRGHEQLIAMRKAGKRPAIVFVNDYPCRTDWFETDGEHVTVCVAGDNLDRADLRFLVGVMVSATGSTEARARALMAACQRAGAAVVGAVHSIAEQRFGSGWCEAWRNPAYLPAPETQEPEVAHG